MTRGYNSIATGLFSNYKISSNGSAFGALTVPAGMRPVSSFRKQERPLITMQFGPPQPWMVAGHEGAASSSAPGSAFGQHSEKIRNMSLAGRKVNPAGYLATWNAQPRSLAPSWNPLLMQGGNMHVQGGNSPLLSSVVTSKFGRKTAKKTVKRKTTTKRKPAKKTVKRKTTTKRKPAKKTVKRKTR